MKSNERLLSAAMRLETVFPIVINKLFRSDSGDPLHGFPVGQVRLLRALFEGEKSGADLCESLNLSQSSLTQMARRLMRAGLVEKKPAPKDRRIRKFALTKIGRRLMADRQSLRARRASQVLSRMPSAQVQALTELLEAMAAEQPKRPLAKTQQAISQLSKKTENQCGAPAHP